MGMRLQPDEIEYIRQAALNGTKTCVMAEWIGCTTETIIRWRNQMGLPAYRKRWTQEREKTLIDLWQQGVEAEDIADRLDTKRDLIYGRVKYLRLKGVELSHREPRRNNKKLTHSSIVNN